MTTVVPRWEIEALLSDRGITRLLGVDEAGRGPGAGPVVAAAVSFEPGATLDEVDDSKALSARRRAQLDLEVRQRALMVGVGIVDAGTIDRVNIRQATRLAMRLAVANALSSAAPRPQLVIVDGDFVFGNEAGLLEQCFVKGDARSLAIAAASIVAKEHRDRLMRAYAERYPGYGFEAHKGYLTRAHKAALARLGPCPIHRLSYKGVG